MNVDPKKFPRLPVQGEILDVVEDGVVIISNCVVTGVEAFPDPRDPNVFEVRVWLRERYTVRSFEATETFLRNGNDSVVELKKLRRNIHLRIMGTMVLRGVK